MGELTHLDRRGKAQMVDVGSKEITERTAIARAIVRLDAETAAVLAAGDAPKGDALALARFAGIQAAKRTHELIPLCHPLPLSFVGVEAEVQTGADPAGARVVLTATARATARTGVEMEALTAASVAALTIYDMVKSIQRGVTITEVALLQKRGGREDWTREG